MLARKVLLPPALAGVAVSCLLFVLALTATSGARRADAPSALVPAPIRDVPPIGRSLELGVSARLHEAPPARTVARVRATTSGAKALATPVAGHVDGCGTFGCPRSGHLHQGVDFLAPAGTPVHAAATGRVALVQSPAQSGGYGNFVCLQHDAHLATCYAHLATVATRVREGARVTRGQVVGLVGATGSASAPHLHFEVRRGAAACRQCAIDPLPLLPGAAADEAPAPAPDTTTRVVVRETAPPAVARAPAPAPPAAPRPSGSTPPAEPEAKEREPATPARPPHIPSPPDVAPQPSAPPATPVTIDPAPPSDAPAAPVPATPTTASSSPAG